MTKMLLLVLTSTRIRPRVELNGTRFVSCP